RIQHRERLALVGLRVVVDLRWIELRALRGPSARIAHPGGVIADDEDHEVPAILELAQLPQHDRVTEVNVRSCRVEPQLHAQRPALLQLALELALRQRSLDVAKEKLRIGCTPIRHPGDARLAPPPDGARSRPAPLRSSQSRRAGPPRAMACRRRRRY